MNNERRHDARSGALQHDWNEGILRAVAAEHGTPTYVYDLERVRSRLTELRAALPEADVRYAVKANPSAAILRVLAGAGAGAEAITLGELERAVRAGIDPARIVLGGPRQDPALAARSAELGVALVSLDSVSQADLWETVDAPDTRFLVRLNPALDPRTHEHLATGAESSKFGMPQGESEAVAARFAKGGRLAGFHVHAGSQIREMSVYDEIFERLAPLYDAHPDARTLDIGGGFAVPGFPLAEFAARVRAFTQPRGLEVILEPGRFLVATAGVLLTRVLHVKRGVVTHVIADAGMADLVRPALYDARHPVRVLGDEGRERELVDVDGPLCENADRLARGVELPRLEPGDLLVVEEAGAYGLTMASNYASSLRPAEVTLERGREGDTVRLARARETVEDLVRLER